MATHHDHSKALRAIGQELVRRGIDLFELRCLRDKYYLQCGDPKPPYVGLIELNYSDDDLISLNRAATALRGNTFKLVKFESLPEILRTLGHYVESKNGDLMRISNSESLPDADTIKVEYETRDGRTHVEELAIPVIAEAGMRMYKERGRNGSERSWRH